MMRGDLYADEVDLTGCYYYWTQLDGPGYRRLELSLSGVEIISNCNADAPFSAPGEQGPGSGCSTRESTPDFVLYRVLVAAATKLRGTTRRGGV